MLYTCHSESQFNLNLRLNSNILIHFLIKHKFNLFHLILKLFYKTAVSYAPFIIFSSFNRKNRWIWSEKRWDESEERDYEKIVPNMLRKCFEFELAFNLNFLNCFLSYHLNWHSVLTAWTYSNNFSNQIMRDKHIQIAIDRV